MQVGEKAKSVAGSGTTIFGYDFAQEAEVFGIPGFNKSID
jgi:hypothetical protein